MASSRLPFQEVGYSLSSMKPQQALILGVAVVASFAFGHAVAKEESRVPVVRIAELEIDASQLGAYTAAVKEEMETSVRVEPGVLAIYAVAEKEHPNRLRFFEIYADETAYKAHLASPHFQKYFVTTKPMIRARKLIETVPVQLSAKAR
jgi:quinol monooxygenase YgiN